MVIYKSLRPPMPIPNVDIFTFLLQDNQFNTTKDLDKPHVIEGETGKSLSWNQIKQDACRLAAGWTENGGLKKGDTVAVFAPNQYDFSMLMFSLWGAQCTISPGNHAYTEAEFRHQITNCQASALVTVPELLPVILKITDSIGMPRSRVFLFGDKQIEGCRPFHSLKSNTPVSIPLKGIDGFNDVALISYSSGTTGLAKGVMLTHSNLVAEITQAILADPEIDDKEAENDVCLGFLPFYHIYGLTSLMLNVFFTVTPVVIIKKFELELLCKLIEQYKITIAAIVPPVAVLLAKHPVAAKYDLSSVRVLGCGAAPLSKEHIDTLAKRIPAQMRQGYGMTETTSGVISQGSQGGVAGSIGRLAVNMELKIVNEKLEELDVDQEGEFLFRGPNIMKGYFNNDKANAETFVDGWMRTGDVGKYDSKTGEFFILDRIKELIKYKGFQVAPAELEAVLMGLDIIADCCVVGVYDNNQATEIPRAYVVLQPSVAADDKAKQIIDSHVTKSVTNYKKLRGGIRFVEAIPKSPSGKILRREVKEWVKKEQKETTEKARL